MSDILSKLALHRLIPVIALDRAEDATPLANALIAGGLPVAEVTFRTAAAESAIRDMSKRSEMLVGAGTVLNVDTVKRAVDAGAKFIVSPGFSEKVGQVLPGTQHSGDARVRHSYGNSNGTGARHQHDQIFSCRGGGWDQDIEGICRPVRAGSVYPYWWNYRGKSKRLSVIRSRDRLRGQLDGDQRIARHRRLLRKYLRSPQKQF